MTEEAVVSAFCKSHLRIQGWGALGPGPPYPQDLFKTMQFSSNFKGKPRILSFRAQGPPPGVKSPLGPPDQNPGSTLESPGYLVAPAMFVLSVHGPSQTSNV